MSLYQSMEVSCLAALIILYNDLLLKSTSLPPGGFKLGIALVALETALVAFVMTFVKLR